MVILLCYTSMFSELIYADFYAKILEWNFCLVDENNHILVVVFVSKLNFSFSCRFVNENYQIFIVVVIFVTEIILLSSTKIFIFVVVDEKNTGCNAIWNSHTCWKWVSPLHKNKSKRTSLRQINLLIWWKRSKEYEIRNKYFFYYTHLIGIRAHRWYEGI